MGRGSTDGAEWFERIGGFLEDIRIPMPGITIDQGVLILDRQRLSHVGDLLHEAGHLAVLTPAQRTALPGKLAADPGSEMAAIAWSWAALTHLGVPPEVVFHQEGYRGDSHAIITAFCQGPAFGVPLLEWMGMTLTGARAAAAGLPPFPHMTRWLRP
jgi:hypothetical protein